MRSRPLTPCKKLLVLPLPCAVATLSQSFARCEGEWPCSPPTAGPTNSRHLGLRGVAANITTWWRRATATLDAAVEQHLDWLAA
eukprot:648817-Alexandrium_andersonii.AAC.1